MKELRRILMLVSFLCAALPATPAQFSYSVVEPYQVPDGHKPKVIGDFANSGQAGIGIYTKGQGFKLYKYPSFTSFLISNFQQAQDSEDAQVADINNDGAPDIVVGGLSGNYWLENPLRQGVDPYTSTWRVHIIDGTNPSHDVVLGDVNRDGKIDVVSESGVYLQGSTPDTWTHVGLANINRSFQGSWLGSLTGDSYLDVLATSGGGTRLSWYENPLHKGGNPVSQVWTEHVIDPAPGFAAGYMTIATVDFNHDGRLDVVMAPMYDDGNLAWYEAPADPRNGTWIKHVIGTTHSVHQGSLQIFDFDGDGNLDIAFAEQEQSVQKRVGIFFNTGGGLSWNLQVLATTGGHNLKAGYIGGDKYPSLLNANHGFFGAPNPVELWRNTSNAAAPAPPPVSTGGPVSDEFNSSTLNTSLWTFQNPLGDGIASVNGTEALISVPPNVAHDPWFRNTAAILTQPVGNIDFGVVVKFDSVPNAQYKMEGIMVESDQSNYLRFEIFHDGANLHLFAASIIANVPKPESDRYLAPTSGSIWMSVRRSGDTWTQSWSTDGVNFTPGVVFSHPLNATKAGFYAGNEGVTSIPGMTTAVDYFRTL